MTARHDEIRDISVGAHRADDDYRLEVARKLHATRAQGLRFTKVS
jgi:hypothetical protein